MAANQEFSIYRQLKEAGVRGLMLDIQYKDGGIRLVHGIVEYSWLDEILMNEISPFLDEDRDAIITIDLETLGDRELIMRQLRVILKQTVNFTKRIFNIHDKRWSDHEWPTIQQMRDADQRIVIFSDNHIVQSEEYGIMLRDNVMFSNMWGILNGCTPRNSYIKDLDIPWSRKKITGAGTRRWSRLFTMNHFCCDTGEFTSTTDHRLSSMLCKLN